MKPKKRWMWIALIVLILASFACSTVGGGEPAAKEEPPAKAPVAQESPTDQEEMPAPTLPVEPATQPPAAAPQETAPPPPQPAPSEPVTYDTEFPLPPDVRNFTKMENGSVNFQTQMTLNDAFEFYRKALSDQGYAERKILTNTTETTFSMVYDGAPDGLSVVVQGVDLGGGLTNVNIRYEKV